MTTAPTDREAKQILIVEEHTERSEADDHSLRRRQ